MNRTGVRTSIVVVMLLASFGSASSQSMPSIVGYIAYVGNDHNVYVVDAANTPTALTTDASEDRRYQFPTWSTDGRLAFFCCDINYSSGLQMEAYLASPDMTRAKLLYAADNEGYTYSYWSPSNCDAGPDCRDLAVLMTQAGQPFKVEIIRNNGVETTSRTAATGAPFYFTWHHDGAQMLWHRNMSVLTFFDAATDTTGDDLSLRPSGFQAPAYSPVDDRAAFVVLEDGGETNALIVADGDDPEVMVRGIPGSIRGYTNVVAVNWSPDGRYLAYRAINRFGASPVFVIDAESGVVAASTAVNNVLAFYWSPDSTKIAYMTPGGLEASASLTRISATQQQQNLFSWSVLDVPTNSARPLVTFTPTIAMLYMLAYFDQFSQSHQIWSPDSRYLVYSDTSDGGSSSVKILDTTADAPVPFTVAAGEIGIWSYN